MSLARDALVAGLVVTVMLTVGLQLKPRELRDVLRRKLLLASGLTFEHIAMPLIALGIAALTGLGPAERAALVLCAATPGGPIGPAFAMQARGNVAFAVTLVVLMGVINVVTTPLTLVVFGIAAQSGESVVLPLVRTIAIFQLLPLAAGMWFNARRPKAAARAASFADKLTKLILAVLIVGMVATQWRLVASLRPLTIVAIFATCIISVTFGWLAAIGDRSDRRALSVTAGVRNLGLALLVATATFSGDEGEATVIAVMVYGLAMLVVSAPAALWMGRRSKRAS